MENIDNLHRLIDTGQEINIKLAYQINPKEYKKYTTEKYGSFAKHHLNYHGNLIDCETINQIINTEFINLMNIDDLSNLLSSIEVLPNLETIFIGSSKIKSDDHISPMNSVKEIIISHCIIEGSLNGFSLFSLVDKIFIENSSMKTLPVSIKDNKKLKELFLGMNFIEELPDWIGEFVYLESLMFHDNRVKYIPDSIGLLRNLKEINFLNNPISYIPESFYDLNVKTILCNPKDINDIRFKNYINDMYYSEYSDDVSVFINKDIHK